MNIRLNSIFVKSLQVLTDTISEEYVDADKFVKEGAIHLFRKDIMTPIGILAGFVVIFVAIYFAGGYDGVLVFFSLSSLAIVSGGLFSSLFVSFGAKGVKNMFTVLRSTFQREEVEIPAFINTLVHLSRSSKTAGMIVGLEQEMERVEDPFIKKGLRLVIDGYDEGTIRKIMEIDIAALEKRHSRGQEMMIKAGDLSPAWGMVGTIIGLVLMLQQLNNPDELGPAIAIALITTFYGALLANLVFIPLANKLSHLTEDEVFFKEVIVDALISISNDESTAVLRDKLHMFLTESAQEPNGVGQPIGDDMNEKKKA